MQDLLRALYLAMLSLERTPPLWDSYVWSQTVWNLRKRHLFPEITQSIHVDWDGPLPILPDVQDAAKALFLNIPDGVVDLWRQNNKLSLPDLKAALLSMPPFP